MPTAASHVWRPSSARAVVLDSFVPVPRGSTATTPRPLAWPVKDPADVLDYLFDISAALSGNDGDCIAELDVEIGPNNPGDLTVDSAAADVATAVLWLSGGAAGTTYMVTISIVTTNGRTLSRTVLLPVVTLSTPPVPLGAIETNTGATLTDQNGNPVLIL
jgi:hypothetical protein